MRLLASLLALSLSCLAQDVLDRKLSCDSDSIIKGYLTPAELTAEFGSDAVPQKIYVGEGFYEDGMVIFPDNPELRLEVVWPGGWPEMVVSFRGPARWNTSGLKIGTDAKTVERLNGKPFNVAGFGFDGAGYLLSWNGGKMSRSNDCEIRPRFGLRKSRSPRELKLSRQIQSDKSYSSRHPAIQAFNPEIVTIYVRFSEPPAHIIR